jgi:hypothetical protein
MPKGIRRRKFLTLAAAGVALPKALGQSDPASHLFPGLVSNKESARAQDSEGHLPAAASQAEIARQLAELSRIGKGNYERPRLKRTGEPRELKFNYHFEETAPGRNSAANEWSAYGTTSGKNAFNCLGRQMRVRYPAYDLAFSLEPGAEDFPPGELESFRLGLVDDKLPAIWAGWEYKGLAYRVSVMAVPFGDAGDAMDLYKLEIRNPSQSHLEGKFVAGVDGPPDMRLEGDVVRGLGDAPFFLTDPPQTTRLLTRDWGLVDKRTKSYFQGGGKADGPGIHTTRIGLDGLPVVYRVKVTPGKQYTVYLASAPRIGKLLPQPKKTGDLVFQYEVEGAAPRAADAIDYSGKDSPPICLRFDGVHDVDGDGYIEIRAKNADTSRLKHTRLSAIYLFPDGLKISNDAAVYSGSMNKQCLKFIDVGITPEVGWKNQVYDLSDAGLCRLNLIYGGDVAPGETKTFWIKVPPIHRRQPASMGAISHAFQQVLPGEAVPPFDSRQIAKMRSYPPVEAERSVIDFWNRFFSRLARIETPDPVLENVYLSRVATRAIHDVKVSEDVWFNVCSPWNYYDFSYRDHCYEAYAYDLAGLHDLAERLLKSYCMNMKDVPEGPIAFGDAPLRLGMREDGAWLTRPGQYDAQGQNLWALVQHYRLSGDRQWLEKTAYPFIRRGAMWLVNSRQRHMQEIKDPSDPRYGLIQAGAMEVWDMKKGMHQYYVDAWAILGLTEAAEAARAAGRSADRELFAREARELRASLYKSFQQTFRRTGLYEGNLWFGVESEGEGMYNFWGHTPLLWPTRTLDAHDPMLTGTFRAMERMANQWGGGLYSDSAEGCWPYITVDWAISYILRGEPEKTLDVFCAYTDTAGLTFSWGEGYENAQNLAGGDQPHNWADTLWLSLFRHLLVMEDGATLLLTPATMRRWQQGEKGIRIAKLPTDFGELDLAVEPRPDGSRIDYHFQIKPRGDQANRPLDKIVINARAPQGRKVAAVSLNGRPYEAFINEQVAILRPERNHEYRLRIDFAS